MFSAIRNTKGTSVLIIAIAVSLIGIHYLRPNQ